MYSPVDNSTCKKSMVPESYPQAFIAWIKGLKLGACAPKVVATESHPVIPVAEIPRTSPSSQNPVSNRA